MRVESVKMIIDAFAEAGRLEQLLPALPKGVTPRCVRVIEQIALLQKMNGSVRVGDISDVLEVTRPGITAVLRDLEAYGYVVKQHDSDDNRVVYVSLTESGEALYRMYVEEYHQHLTEVLSEIGDDGAKTIANLVSKILALISTDTVKAHPNAKAFRK